MWKAYIDALWLVWWEVQSKIFWLSIIEEKDLSMSQDM